MAMDWAYLLYRKWTYSAVLTTKMVFFLLESEGDFFYQPIALSAFEIVFNVSATFLKTKKNRDSRFGIIERKGVIFLKKTGLPRRSFQKEKKNVPQKKNRPSSPDCVSSWASKKQPDSFGGKRRHHVSSLGDLAL